MVVRVLDRERRLGDLERAEAIHHYRQLVGVFRANARFGAARMRTVWDSVRVMSDAAELDSLAAHELARCVVQNLVGIDVAVIVRSGDCFGMEVVRPRAERADYEPIALKSL